MGVSRLDCCVNGRLLLLRRAIFQVLTATLFFSLVREIMLLVLVVVVIMVVCEGGDTEGGSENRYF